MNCCWLQPIWQKSPLTFRSSGFFYTQINGQIITERAARNMQRLQAGPRA